MNRMKLTLVGFIFIDEKVRIIVLNKSGFDEGDVQ
jgi:hypothetical protein